MEVSADTGRRINPVLLLQQQPLLRMQPLQVCHSQTICFNSDVIVRKRTELPLHGVPAALAFPHALFAVPTPALAGLGLTPVCVLFRELVTVLAVGARSVDGCYTDDASLDADVDTNSWHTASLHEFFDSCKQRSGNFAHSYSPLF